MLQVWVGLLEVTQIPGDQLVTLSQCAAFTWFTAWADSAENFKAKAAEVMLYYGLHVMKFDEVSAAVSRADVEGELLEQIERTQEARTHALYGTFHTYPPQYN